MSENREWKSTCAFRRRGGARPKDGGGAAPLSEYQAFMASSPGGGRKDGEGEDPITTHHAGGGYEGGEADVQMQHHSWIPSIHGRSSL